MNIEELRSFCLGLNQATETMPFDDNILVFSVKNKMFCLTNINTFSFINLKCDPENAINLRELYQDVTPGYHMNKTHWNSVNPKGSIPDKLIKEWIVDSYNLVVSKLPQKIKNELI